MDLHFESHYFPAQTRSPRTRAVLGKQGSAQHTADSPEASGFFGLHSLSTFPSPTPPFPEGQTQTPPQALF